MKISIAMATYNGAKYLKAQLQSLVDQTRQPDELIINDDCSTDETEAIVREFARKAPFKVEFFRNEKNMGYCGNFNAALMKTTGDLVFLSDQDDVWFPEKIEHVLGVTERNPEALVVMNDAALTDAHLNEVGLTKIGQLRSAGLLMDNFVMGCCCALRRELLELCMPVPIGFQGHDNWLVWVADGLSAKVVVPKSLQFYRRHESNESLFIANRTEKVTRLQVFLHSVNEVLRKDSVERESARLGQLQIYVDGVHAIQSDAPKKYLQHLIELENRVRQKLETAEKRILVRRQSLFHRIIAVGSLFRKGEYRNTSGLKAILRDIVG